MSGQSIGALAGGVIGGVLVGIGTFGTATFAGVALGASIGSTLGGIAGALYDSSTADDLVNEQQSLADLKLQSSTYGRAIPQVWGRFAVAGNVIWSQDKIEWENRSSSGGGGSGGGAKQVNITKSYTLTWAIALADTRLSGPIDHIESAWRDTTLIVAGGVLPGNWTFYPGSATQTPDVIMELFEGVGNVPAYHYTAYVLILADELGPSGRTPNYTFELATRADVNGEPLADVITDLCAPCGLPAASLALDELPGGQTVNMALVSLQAARAPIEQLRDVFRFYTVESGTILKFRERGAGESVATIPEEALGAGEEQRQDISLQVSRRHELDLPRQLTVTHLDPSQNYQQNSQIAQLDLPEGTIDTPRNVNTTLGLYPATAKQAAEELLAEAWIQRESFAGSLGSAYALLEPGDRITVTARSLTYGLVLTETTYGRPGLLEFQALPDANFVRGAPVPDPGDVPFVPPDPVSVGDTTPLLLNIPALDANDRDVHLSVAFVAETSSWGGAALFRSMDGGSSYTQIDGGTLEAITGTVALALDNADPHFLDTVTTFDVVLEHGSLATVSDVALYNGANLCFIGNQAFGEILGFGVATLIGPMTYTCSRLLRGRRGTEWFVGLHGTAEHFALLDMAVRKVNISLAERYVERDYKAVTYRQTIDLATSYPFTATAISMNPWSPAQPLATQSGADWVFTWLYRGRFGGDWVDGGGIGFDFDFNGFQITIYSDATYTVIKRVILTDGGNPMDPETEKTYIYTSADQTTDFGSPQATIYARIYQVNVNGTSMADDLVGS